MPLSLRANPHEQWGRKQLLFTGVERTNVKRPFLVLLFSPPPGHLETGESMKPARIPASSSLWAISFLLRIYCLIYQVGGITDPVDCSQGQYIKGHKCFETYEAPDKGILQLSPPLSVWHSFNMLDKISSNLHQPTRPQRTGRGVIKSD